jgi:hypothetical protein
MAGRVVVMCEAGALGTLKLLADWMDVEVVPS